jgi:hypothetical protein
MSINYKIDLAPIVARQLPEFVREDYPTFVAFVEAYYSYLKTQQYDLNQTRDIDETLDKFITYFKQELAYNAPYLVEDQRFYLQRIKDAYLSKGSEASYKLLFKLLFNKDVIIKYPGDSVLRASDGQWNQEISIFVKVAFGDINDIIGRVVTIESSQRIIRVTVDRKQEIEGEIERIIPLGDNIYEVFLDRKFYGKISPGNSLKYGDDFLATVLPTTSIANVLIPGKGFRIGQVFKVQSTSGTGALIKVIRVGPDGELLNIQLIKFGVGYLADFATTIYPSSSIVSITNTTPNLTTFTKVGSNVNISDTPILCNEYGFINSNNYFQDLSDGGVRQGTITATTSTNVITGTGTSFLSTSIVPKIIIGDLLKDTDGNDIGYVKSIDSNTQITLTKRPTINFTNSEYQVHGAYVDGTFAGTLLKEFSVVSVYDIGAQEPAIVEIKLDGIAKYPGYYETNDGFVSDSIFIQDSKYYQTFSYVVSISERLDAYKSAVKTMLHPAGMAMFGEFDLVNNFNLEVELESILKLFGITVRDDVFVEDEEINYVFAKYINNHKLFGGNFNDTNIAYATDNVSKKDFFKALDDSFSFSPDILTYNLSQSLSDSFLLEDSIIVGRIFPETITLSEQVGLNVDSTYTDTVSGFFETFKINDNIYMELPSELVITSNEGYVVLNAYEEGHYFSEIYANARDAIISN